MRSSSQTVALIATFGLDGCNVSVLRFVCNVRHPAADAGGSSPPRRRVPLPGQEGQSPMKLTPEQLETVLFALADGRDYRIGRLGDCDDLEQGTACEAHKDDLEKS